LEQTWALKIGQKGRVVGLSKEEALEKAVGEVLANTDRRDRKRKKRPLPELSGKL
jgi:hypothetical protein